jgi:hypothetical protein
VHDQAWGFDRPALALGNPHLLRGRDHSREPVARLLVAMELSQAGIAWRRGAVCQEFLTIRMETQDRSVDERHESRISRTLAEPCPLMTPA